MNYLFTGTLQAFKLLLHGDASTYAAVFTTIKVSLSSIIISLLIGIPKWNYVKEVIRLKLRIIHILSQCFIQ